MIKELVIRLLNKKILQNIIKIELSIGTIYLKQLTNGILRKCQKNSCIAGDVLNEPYFMTLIEYELCTLSKSQISTLSISDGRILRESIKQLLIKEKVVKVVDEEFNVEDKQILEKMKNETKVAHEKLYEQTGYKAPGVGEEK